MKCPKCNSNNTKSESEEGDNYFECFDCKYIIENNIEMIKKW